MRWFAGIASSLLFTLSVVGFLLGFSEYVPEEVGFATLLPLLYGLPYATALVALRFLDNRVAVGLAILFNGLLVVGELAHFVVSVALGGADPLAGVTSLMFVVPAALNCLMLPWPRALPGEIAVIGPSRIATFWFLAGGWTVCLLIWSVAAGPLAFRSPTADPAADSGARRHNEWIERHAFADAEELIATGPR